MNRNRYEVHTYTHCQGWVNCWTVTEEGEEQPDSYPSIEAAQAEIDMLLSDIEQEIKDGLRDADHGDDAENYCIFDTIKQEYVA